MTPLFVEFTWGLRWVPSIQFPNTAVSCNRNRNLVLFSFYYLSTLVLNLNTQVYFLVIRQLPFLLTIVFIIHEQQLNFHFYLLLLRVPLNSITMVITWI